MAPFSAEDCRFMEEALLEAQAAADIAEVPVGAVVVKDGRIIGRGHNRKETGKDATLHAEMIAIRQACACLGGWRLPGAALYVTLEPCPMCAGALAHSHIGKVVYAAEDPKNGFSRFGNMLHPKTKTETGVMREECLSLLTEFFKKRR